MAIMIGFFALLVVALLGIELLVGLAGRGRRKRAGCRRPTKTGLAPRRGAQRGVQVGLAERVARLLQRRGHGP